MGGGKHTAKSESCKKAILDERKEEKKGKDRGDGAIVNGDQEKNKR